MLAKQLPCSNDKVVKQTYAPGKSIRNTIGDGIPVQQLYDVPLFANLLRRACKRPCQLAGPLYVDDSSAVVTQPLVPRP